MPRSWASGHSMRCHIQGRPDKKKASFFCCFGLLSQFLCTWPDRFIIYTPFRVAFGDGYMHFCAACRFSRKRGSTAECHRTLRRSLFALLRSTSASRIRFYRLSFCCWRGQGKRPQRYRGVFVSMGAAAAAVFCLCCTDSRLLFAS